MHIKNFTKSQKGHILTHNENSDVRKKLKNVDAEKTKFNYNLAPEREETALEYWAKRFDESKHSNQKKTAVMSDIVITQPKEVKNENSEVFFKASYNFLKERYGEENIISAWVHLDEPNAQPHLHFCMLPINKDLRCSARGVFSKEELQSVHIDLQEHLNKELNFSVSVLNGSTANGNRTIEQLKAETLKRENDALKDKINEEKRIINYLQGELIELQEKNLKESAREKALKEVYKDVEERCILERENKELKEQLEDSVSQEEYKELYNLAVKMDKFIVKNHKEEFEGFLQQDEYFNKKDL